MWRRPDLWLIPGILLASWAQWRLLSLYRRWSTEPTERGLTGAQAAREILDSADLQDVPIQTCGGVLTDHYDPPKRTLRLSKEVFEGNSIASVGIAAHEAGHALQHKTAYGPLRWRMALVPMTLLGAWLALPLYVVGLALRISPVRWAGALLFLAILAFHLVTLPVEFDASRRAQVLLRQRGMVSEKEAPAVEQMLGAAAWTYIAAFLRVVLALMRLFALTRLPRF